MAKEDSLSFNCERCGRKLQHDKAVWLEFWMGKCVYVCPSEVTVPVDESQGCFPFGKDCAKAAMSESMKKLKGLSVYLKSDKTRASS